MNNTKDEAPHSEHSHSHSVDDRSERRVVTALIITGIFMLSEVIGGIVSGSLVLLADAGHMLTDFFALGLSWIGFRIAKRAPDEKRSFGYHRFPVLAAFTNGLTLLFISAVIFYEAVERFFMPPEKVRGGLMLVVAAAGLVANLFCYFMLTVGQTDNINIKSAALHVLSDLLGSIAAMIAALVIIYTDWILIDPILSIVVCLLILRSAWKIVSKAGHILMQGTPPGLDAEEVRTHLLQEVEMLEDVHHIHIWELTEGKPVVSLHARVAENADLATALRLAKEKLRDRFNLDHSVVQIESAAEECPD